MATNVRTLDELGVPPEIRERAKMLWLITLLAGLWGWIICNFAWKVEGQDGNEWYQFQLKQALFAGLAGWIGMVFFGLGWFISAIIGLLGFLAVNKGEDFEAPLLGGFARTTDIPGLTSGVTKTATLAQRPPAVTGPVASSGSLAGNAAQEQVNAAIEDGRAQHQAAVEQMSNELEPVEGVSLQHWAWAQAYIAQGHAVDSIISQIGLDQARWDRVSAEWNARMSRDATATIATEYGKYFVQSGAGQYGAAGQAAAATMTTPDSGEVGGTEPIPFERWVELTVAMEAAADKGWDVGQLLGQFGLTPADWGTASAWWSQKFAAHAMDQGTSARYDQLRTWYEAHYKGAPASGDVQV
jgi:hypothetical protein